MDDIKSGTSLVIAPDASSNEYAIHQELSEKGIDILILDHHQAPKVSEYACVVNNQLCNYPTKSLSGVGIVYKFCQYLDRLFGDPLADKFLDIVAIGLVGDVMDMRDFETHYLVQQGLKHFNNPFIEGMATKNSYSLGDTISPIGVAFYVVPLINAVTRVGTMEEKQLLFESMLEWKAKELIPSTKRGCKGQQETRVEQSLRTCGNVKNRQTRDQSQATEQIETLIQNNNLLTHKVLIVCLDELDFDRGIVGLVANQLMARYQRPVCLLVRQEKEEGVFFSGSARACEIDDFRAFCENSGMVEYARGHASAFGISIQGDKIQDFIEFCDREFADKDFTPKYKVDYIYSASGLNPEDILEFEQLKPLYGQNIEEPLIAIEHLSITKEMLSLMSRDKNPTLKIQLPNGVSCIKFKSSEEEYESLFSDKGCVTINLVGKPEVNKYFNKITPQILVQDYEIINKQEFYF